MKMCVLMLKNTRERERERERERDGERDGERDLTTMG